MVLSGNSGKCGTIVVTVLLLWSHPGNGAKCPRSASWQEETQSIQDFFWRSWWSVGTKLHGRWQLKNGENSPSTINNHLWFDVQAAYNSTRERERERVGGREKEREREGERKREREREGQRERWGREGEREKERETGWEGEREKEREREGGREKDREGEGEERKRGES